MTEKELNDIGYLYIIKDVGATGWYKIGKTVEPIQRLRQYNCSFPEDRIVYEYLSDKIYNLSNAEIRLIDKLRSNNNILFSKYEWIKHKSSARSAKSAAIKIIEEIVDYYLY